MDEPPKKRGLLYYISAHPVAVIIIFVGSIASILAVVLVFFPWWFAPKRELSFCINPNRAPIVQTAKESKVSVSYGGRPVAGNVTAAQIAIWNAGREPIRREDILSPIVLSTPEGCGILEISVLIVSRDVTDFRVIITQSLVVLTSNEVAISTNRDLAATLPTAIPVDWKIFEQNDGALIQIIYTGTTEAPIRLKGTIVGQSEPRQRFRDYISKQVMASQILCLVVFLAGASYLSTKFVASRTNLKRLLIVTLIYIGFGALIVFLFFLMIRHFNAITVTPFGF